MADSRAMAEEPQSSPGSAAGMAPDDTRGLVEVRPTDIDELREHATKLYEDHYEEIATDKGSMTLSPNWHTYYKLEEQELLIAMAAWVGDQMVGYSISHKYMHLHYRDLMVVENDVLFVAKEHRRGGLGIHLIRETMLVAKKHAGDAKVMGGDAKVMVSFHAKPDTPLCAILEAEGFGLKDLIYCRFL